MCHEWGPHAIRAQAKHQLGHVALVLAVHLAPLGFWQRKVPWQPTPTVSRWSLHWQPCTVVPNADGSLLSFHLRTRGRKSWAVPFWDDPKSDRWWFTSDPIGSSENPIQSNPIKKKGNSHEVPIQLTIRSWGFTPLWRLYTDHVLGGVADQIVRGVHLRWRLEGKPSLFLDMSMSCIIICVNIYNCMTVYYT